ncbi:MAG: hypothetical protein QXP04_05135, partial [Candidatus Nanoarchaeia archaeon]|nr:hypothetical protein [Candidatus Jingweiarchaeum tengchongense]
KIVEEKFYYEEPSGRLSTKVINSLGHISNVIYDYDNYGNVILETSSLDANRPSKVIVSEYAHGFLIARYFSGEGKGAKKIIYNPSGSIKEIWLDEEGVNRINYEESSTIPRLENISYYNGGNTSWTSGVYQYDYAGNIIEIGEDKFYYDSLLRLKKAEVHRKDGSGNRYTIGYSYDQYGNLLSKMLNPDAGDFSSVGMEELIPFVAVVDQYTNRLLQVKFGQNGNMETIPSDAYDGNGNTLKFNEKQMCYTEDNLLKKVVKNDLGRIFSEYYYYNFEGERTAELTFSSPDISASRYYLKEGTKTVGEVSYTYDHFLTTSIREKWYLYVGDKILATSENEASIITTTQSTDQKLVNTTRVLCPIILAEMNGSRKVVSLSDPVVTDKNGNNFDLCYMLENVTDDLVGVVVRLARIKDEGNSGSRGDSGNGCPRNDEDKVQIYYFLKDGLEADFVFKGFGLCGNQGYGEIVSLEPWQVYPVYFSDLQKDKLYRITLYGFTEIGADPNIGYNLFTSEEGEIICPKKEPRTHLSIKTMTKEDSNGELKTYLRGKWGDISGAKRYNLLMKKLNGEKVAVNGEPLSKTEYEIDAGLLSSAGISLSSEYELEGITDSDIILPGPIIKEGKLDPIKCPLNPIHNYTTPVIKNAYIFSNVVGYNSSIGYVDWDGGKYPAPYYEVYRKIDFIEPQRIGRWNAIGVTSHQFYVDETIGSLQGSYSISYYVQPLGYDLQPVADQSWPKMALDISSGVGISVRNTSIGDVTRHVEIKAGGRVSYPMPFTEDEIEIKFSAESGFVLELLRAYSSNESWLDCNHFSDSDFVLYQTFYDTSQIFIDENFNPEDENPIVGYKARIRYKNSLTIAETDCKWTHVSYCYERPSIESFSGVWAGSFERICREWDEAKNTCGIWVDYPEVHLEWEPVYETDTMYYSVTPCYPLTPFTGKEKSVTMSSAC